MMLSVRVGPSLRADEDIEAGLSGELDVDAESTVMAESVWARRSGCMRCATPEGFGDADADAEAAPVNRASKSKSFSGDAEVTSLCLCTDAGECREVDFLREGATEEEDGLLGLCLRYGVRGVLVPEFAEAFDGGLTNGLLWTGVQYCQRAYETVPRRKQRKRHTKAANQQQNNSQPRA